MTFSEKRNHSRKMANYKRLLRNLKRDPNANSHIVKNSQALNDIKDVKEQVRIIKNIN
jgi:NRPS condensation-like uncharacterized protein